MCILEQLHLQRDSKFSEEEEGQYLLGNVDLFQSIMCIQARQKVGLSMNTSYREKPGGFKTQGSFFICSSKSTRSNSTSAVRDWLSLALEGRTQQAAPTVSTTLCSQAVSPPYTQTCLTLLSKHIMAKVMRIMLQAEKWICAVPHAVIFYFISNITSVFIRYETKCILFSFLQWQFLLVPLCFIFFALSSSHGSQQLSAWLVWWNLPI